VQYSGTTYVYAEKQSSPDCPEECVQSGEDCFEGYSDCSEYSGENLNDEAELCGPGPGNEPVGQLYETDSSGCPGEIFIGAAELCAPGPGNLPVAGLTGVPVTTAACSCG
jgi:hypothetical protein